MWAFPDPVESTSIENALDVSFGSAFERRVKEARVAGHLLDVLVRRDDEQRHPGGGTSGSHGGKRFCRRRQAGNDPR